MTMTADRVLDAIQATTLKHGGASVQEILAQVPPAAGNVGDTFAIGLNRTQFGLAIVGDQQKTFKLKEADLVAKLPNQKVLQLAKLHQVTCQLTKEDPSSANEESKDSHEESK